MATPICGCCGAAECNQCDPLFPPPLTLKVDLGGPYTCNTGGGNPCAFTMGGLYTMRHPDTLLGFGECNWTYKSQVCHPSGGSPGFLTLRFYFSTSGTPHRANLDVIARHPSAESIAGYRIDLVGDPPRNCMALFTGGGLVLPRIASDGALCIPSFPLTLTVHA